MPLAGRIVQLSPLIQANRLPEGSQQPFLVLNVPESAQSVHSAYSSDLTGSCRAHLVRGSGIAT